MTGNGTSSHVDSSGMDKECLALGAMGSSTDDTKGSSASPTGTSYKTETRRAVTMAAEIKHGSVSSAADVPQSTASSSNSASQFVVSNY